MVPLGQIGIALCRKCSWGDGYFEEDHMPAIFAKSAGLLALSILALTTIDCSMAAEPSGLTGSWTGSGRMRYPSGDSERARCRATFSHSHGCCA